MPTTRFKILLALSSESFVNRVTQILKKIYSVYHATTIQEFSDLIHKGNFDLVIVDYRFAGMKAEDVYQGVEFLHPHAVFVVYTDKQKEKITKKLWKRRAIDYITYTTNPYAFVDSVNKVARWAIQRRDTVSLERTLKNIEGLVADVKAMVKKWK